MNYKMLIFGGTTEGRKLAEYFCGLPVEVHISVATEYGEKVLDNSSDRSITVLQGRMNSLQMAEKIKRENYNIVVDATHPYALECSENIKQACMKTNTEYCRISRKLASEGKCFTDVEEAVSYLKQTTGNIFVTTGSKELPVFLKEKELFHRIYARVLPSDEILYLCMREYGMEGSHIAAMQGPFSERMNVAMLEHCNAKYLVTKDSGKPGGFYEKVQAAERVGAEIVIIGNTLHETGYTLAEGITYLCRQFNLNQKRTIAFIGIGMGNHTLTEEAMKELQQADCIIGAARMLDAVAQFQKEKFIAARPNEIVEMIEENVQYKRIAIVLSGDIGFYSGSKKLYDYLKKYEIKTICGISSLSYFMARLNMTWEDVHLISLHGRQENLIGAIESNFKCFALLSSGQDILHLCRQLRERNMNNVMLYVGENLSYPQEQITIGTAVELCDKTFQSLSVLLAVNPNAVKRNSIHFADTAFQRGNAPMTKREIREVSLAYLGIKENDIFYDIGAGTGSVAISGAVRCPYGMVYAIEKKEDALVLLQENKEKMGIGNLTVIEGEAPQVLETLPSPDKVFIGGSSGKMEKILQAVLSKNPFAEIVINVITLESLIQVMESFKKLEILESEFTHVSISKSERAGGLHMMKGNNPVYIISGRGSGKLCSFPD